MSLLSEFCSPFGVQEQDLGHISRIGRRCFLTLPEQEKIIEEQKKNLFGAGVYLGEEKTRFEHSPAILEILSAQTKDFKAVVDDKAEWLFLCGRDIFDKGIEQKGIPTANGLFLVENNRGENLGLGKAARDGNVAIKNIMDRGHFLRRERMK
ncbi:hypothetical protein GOV07_01300 [Candidatus Woesearchaeota archaeon]|nr:hypothetical protein [Candidatus Woesearchaeota archaeon]